MTSIHRALAGLRLLVLIVLALAPLSLAPAAVASPATPAFVSAPSQGGVAASGLSPRWSGAPNRS